MLLRDNSGYPGGLFSFQQLPAALKPQATYNVCPCLQCYADFPYQAGACCRRSHVHVNEQQSYSEVGSICSTRDGIYGLA